MDMLDRKINRSIAKGILSATDPEAPDAAHRVAVADELLRRVEGAEEAEA